MAEEYRYSINIKQITDVAEREIATKAAKEIESPGVISKSAEISRLIGELKTSSSEQVVTIAKELEIALNRALTGAVKNIGPEISKVITQQPKEKRIVTTPAKEVLPYKKERSIIPAVTQVAEKKSLIDSSDVLMNQIRKDYESFKVKFAKTVKSQLVSAYGESFQIIGKGSAQYTKRGGVDVLKIADIGILVNALKMLTNTTEEAALKLAKEKGAEALVTKASRATMEEFSGEFGKTKTERTQRSIAKITEYINKHGYEGLNKGIQQIVQKQQARGLGVTEQQIRKALVVREEGAKRGAVSQERLMDLLSETAGRSRVYERIGAAIKEIEIPRPQKGPQGMPAMQMPSGRYRALAQEYRFTPGIMVAQKMAENIISTGGKEIESKKALAQKVQKISPELPKMIVEDQKAALAEHASSIMDVMKTDKKGRLELINAYRTTLSAKYGREPTQQIPKSKVGQLKYLDDLANKAKKAAIGFDDVLVAMGKFSKTSIYDRLFDTLTKESVGITSPLRTTVKSLGEGLTESTQSVKTFNKRVREPFTEQELVEEDLPLLSWYQGKSSKLNVPVLTGAAGGEIVAGELQRKQLVAHNREIEKYLALSGKQFRLSSQGVGESRSVKLASDVTDPFRMRMNVFAGNIREYIPLGEWSNFARTLAPTYHALGGGKALGGKVIGELETPLLQSIRGRAAEKEGLWGEGGYGLNLQTVIKDSAGTFEDQIEIAGKAVNRFAKYIKPMIKDVSGVEGAELVAKDIVSKYAPDIGKTFGIGGVGEGETGREMVSEISKVLTSAGGESLEAVAVKIVERLFTALGTKMTTHYGSKGVVKFGKGEEGELGYVEQATSYHKLIQKMLETKKGVSRQTDKEIDKLITDLDELGTMPFVEFMHKDLSKEVQSKCEKIRNAVSKILDIDIRVATPESIEKGRKKAKQILGAGALTEKIATEVRMSLTGATKRLNLAEPLEVVINNIAGNVKGAIAPKLTPEQLTSTGEVSKYLQAMGYGWGPEEKFAIEERTLPMYSGKGAGGVIAGQKFWRYTREPSRYEEWSQKQIERRTKGQKLNVAAMAALMSTFGEGSAVVQETLGGYKPDTGAALENIFALKTLEEEPVKTKAPYISTKGIRELPGVISKYKDLRDTVLDIEKFGAGGFVKVPEFEEGKEIGRRPLYIPSRKSLGAYAEEGGAVSANKLAVLYNSLLSNVEDYEKIKKTKYLKGEKANVDVLRRNVKDQIGETSSVFRNVVSKAFKQPSAVSDEDLKNLIAYFEKIKIILKEASAVGDVGLGAMKTPVRSLLNKIGSGISLLEKASKAGKGLGKKEARSIVGLLMNVKDNMLEPKIDVGQIESFERDLERMKAGKPFTELESYFYYKKRSREKPDIGEKGFEEETPKAREWITNALKRGIDIYSAGVEKPGLLSVSEGALGVAAKQFGVTTDVKEQALEEKIRLIERDKQRLKKALIESTIGKGKGVESFQTRVMPAVRGTLSAAINSKVEDFKEAAEIINRLSEKGVLGDPNKAKSLGNTLVNSIITQTEKHEKAVEAEKKAGAVVLREGEVGIPAAKMEKLTGDYGKAGKTLLDAVREGQNVPVMTTRFPMTGIASHQFGIAKELVHPRARDVIAIPGGVAPGVDIEEMKRIKEKLELRQASLRKERSELPIAEKGTAKAKELDAQRAELTKNIMELSKAIDLLTVKFAGYAQNADLDGDEINVHAAKTKKARKEIEAQYQAARKGVYGKVGTLDPRAFINQMMNYKEVGLTGSMAELADLYTSRAGIPGAKIFKTPDITEEMKHLTTPDVLEGLKNLGITVGHLSKIAEKKGIVDAEGIETFSRKMLYEKVRAKQYENLYVKTGLGESTEAISRLARIIETSIGFGDRQVTKSEYAAWKPESVALGAVYGKGGELVQKAVPAREMQTMMNALLEQVINASMSAKHGGKAIFQEVTQGMASGTLFATMQKEPERFKGILKANEIIKTTIKDRLDALNSEDFLSEVRRMSPETAKGKTDKELLMVRKDITEAYADQFSFKGFLSATAKDIQNQVLKTAKTPKQKAMIEEQIASGELDLGRYFSQMQPLYSLRTSTASVEKFAKQVEKGKTTLDKAIIRVLEIIKQTGSGVSVSDVMMQDAFKDMFAMFNRMEKFGVNLGKIFKSLTTAKQKRRGVAVLEEKLGVPRLTTKEKEMIMAEGAAKFKKERPKAKEEEIEKFQQEYLFQHRKKAIEQYVKSAEYKKDLMFSISPIVGEQYKKQVAEEEEYAAFTKKKKGRAKKRAEEYVQQFMFPGYSIGTAPPPLKVAEKPLTDVKTKYEQARLFVKEKPKKIPPRGPLMLPLGYGYVSEEDVPDIPEKTVLKREALVRERGKIEVLTAGKKAETKIDRAREILEGGVKGIDYAAFGDLSAVKAVNMLKEYNEALNFLLGGAKSLTNIQIAKIQEALTFIKQNMSVMTAVPGGTELGVEAKKAVKAYKVLEKEGLADFAARVGISLGGVPPAGVPPGGAPPGNIPPGGVPPGGGKPKYKSKLEALMNLIAAAEKRTGFTQEGLPEPTLNVLEAVRAKEISPLVAPEILKASMKGVSFPKQQTVWAQYHLERARAEADIAQQAEEAGDIYGREKAIGKAGAVILRSYGKKTTPFLKRAESGRVLGYADEAAVEQLGLYRVPHERERVLKAIEVQSATAGKAVAPVLMGAGRMEERLKTMWAEIRRFNPELAKSGKAFNFEKAKADLAIIKEELKAFRIHGMFSPEEYSDLEHAVRQVTKMEKAVQETPAAALPTLVLPGLETRETAEAAAEALLQKHEKEMLAEKGLVVGAKRKVAFKIPTEEGLVEKRTVTLVARGAKEGLYAPGVVGGIERIEEKPTVEKEEVISRRAVRLIKEFESSTKNVNEKIKDVWLGIKRFDDVAGTVNFDEALKDLADMQMILNEMIKTPGISSEKFVEFSQLKRKIGTAIRTVAETAPEALPGIIMKGMETPESAEAAFRKQVELEKAAMWEDASLAVGKTMKVAATVPLTTGVVQRRQVQLKAVGEGGVVTGIEEQESKAAKEYARELEKNKKTRASTLVSKFMEGTGDVNKRISDMLLGVKQFDVGLVKAGKHTEAINFDNAENDLVEIIALLKEAQNGAVILSEEERAAYKQAQLAAQGMYQKVVKTPIAARKGITMGGYETPESSLAAFRSRIEEGKEELKRANQIGKSMLIKGKLLTESGEEVAITKRLTARGKYFGLAGPVTKVSEREEVGGGQIGSVLRRVSLWGAASGVVYGIIGGARQMIEVMKQAETGLVNLKKVMSPITTNFDNMRNSAVRFAKDYGAELMGVFETMRIFAQQGLPQEQVKEMARVSTLAANVTTMKPAEAAEALTSATRQFNIEGEKSISILDSWNEVENKFAITAKDLADGFKKAGTAAKVMGIGVHKLNGIITAIGEATRQTGKEVGTSLKFIFSRMGTQKAPKALTAIGVKTIEGGRLRRGSDVLDDLAKKWVGLTRAQKLATAQAMGGIRHYNALMVLMEHYDRALAASAVSINSVGSAEKENKLVMETLAKKSAQLKASFNALAISASGPILTGLKALTDSLKAVTEAIAGIHGGALATIGTSAYLGATALGKYFDLSMFGLLGPSIGGAKRKRRTPRELVGALFGGKQEKGREVFEKVRQMSPKALLPKVGTRVSGIGRGLVSGASFAFSGAMIEKSVKSMSSLVKATGKASLSVLGLVTSLGALGTFISVIASLGVGMYLFNKAVTKTFASAEDRTKDYKKALDVVEEKIKSISNVKMIRSRVEIRGGRIKALEELTEEQIASQVKGRSYKSPLLMKKEQIESIREYATAVVSLTSEGFIGFDKFGKSIVSSTDKLDSVIAKLEEIAVNARINLKLHIEKEELDDLMKAVKIKGSWKKLQYMFKEGIGNLGEMTGFKSFEKYADKRRTLFERMIRSSEKINKMRYEAGQKGEIIRAPLTRLKEINPEEYSRQEDRFKRWSALQKKHLNIMTEFNDKFLEIKRDFFTMAGPGMTPELAGKAAFGATGRALAELEQQKNKQFYKGISVEDIQASFAQRLSGVNIRASAELTKQAAMEQGIPFRGVSTEEERRNVLEEAIAKDVFMFKKGSGYLGDMVSVFEKGVGDASEKWVKYSVEVSKNQEKGLKFVTDTLENFKKTAVISDKFIGVINAVGMLTDVEVRLRKISRYFVGAEAGMYKPIKEGKLELGSMYRYQIKTPILIQNNAYKVFSKETMGFINEYVKRQEEVRKAQKAAFAVNEKHGDVAKETSKNISELINSLTGLSNVAIQDARVIMNLKKALEQIDVTYEKQELVQKFRTRTMKRLTGPLAGMELIPTPKINMRKMSELPIAERAFIIPEYAKKAKEYNVKELEYMKYVKRGEKIVTAEVDLKYIKDLSKQKGFDKKEFAAVSENILKTGELSTAVLLTETQKQTKLEQKTANTLGDIKTILESNKPTGLTALSQAMKETGEINRDIAVRGASLKVKADIGRFISNRDIKGTKEYLAALKETLGEKEGNKLFIRAVTELGSSIPGIGDLVTAAQQSSKYKELSPNDVSAIYEQATSKEALTLVKSTKKSPAEVQESLKNSESLIDFTKVLLPSIMIPSPAGLVTAVATAKNLPYNPTSTLTPEQEKIAGKEVSTMGFGVGIKNNEKIVRTFIDLLENRFEGLQEEKRQQKESKIETGVITNKIATPEKVMEEVLEKIGISANKNKEKIKNLSDELINSGKSLENIINSFTLFAKVTDPLVKSIENLSFTFKNLDMQSAKSQKLIESRAKRLNVKGGPLYREALPIGVDVSTTARYSPHEILYNRDQEYRENTISYLKQLEKVKAVRSKTDITAGIMGQVDFLKQQGISNERLNSMIEGALETGSVELGPVISVLNEIAKNTAKTAEGVERTSGKRSEFDVKSEEAVDKTTPGLEKLQKLYSQYQAKALVEEDKARKEAEKLRIPNIRQQTRMDIAAGRGKSLDQITREENELRATLGRVPSEIKERNRKLLEVYEAEKEARATFELEKRKILEPLQQSVSGMKSIIDSIKTGLSGIESARNIRPLEIDFSKWAKRQGTSELSQERVADRRMQFDLAKNLYSQNLSLRAQGVDTGIDPKELYNIMERASRGEDITKYGGSFGTFIGRGGPLEAIQKNLSVAVEAKEKRIRDVQAEEYATAIRGAISPSNDRLDSIKNNIGKLIISGENVGASIIDAINRSENVKSQPIIVDKRDKVGASYERPLLTEGQKKYKSFFETTGITVRYPGQEFSQEENRRQIKESLEKKGMFVTYPEQEKNVTFLPSVLEAGKEIATKRDKIKEFAVKPKAQLDSQKNIEVKQSDEILKKNKKLNIEVSNLKDEIEVLKESVIDVNKLFVDLSDNLKNVNSVGEASKSSKDLIDDLGESASKTAISLDTLSTKINTIDVAKEESGPTAAAEKEVVEYISEEEALNLINNVKEELSESIDQLSNDSKTVAELVEKTRILSEDVEIIKNTVPVETEEIESTDFIAFKEEIVSCSETIKELKGLVEDLDTDVANNTASVLVMESGFELINKKLDDHDSALVQLQTNLGAMGAKFTNAINELREEVAEAKDLAWSARVFASQT